VSGGLLSRLVQLLLPTRCALCQQLGPQVVCESCRSGLEPVGPRCCPRCGRRRLTEFASPDCSECFGRSLGVTRARSLYIYNETGRALLAEFKFKGHLGAGLALIDPLAAWAGAGLTALYCEPDLRFDFAVPVPLHKSRLRHRRFNQAELIAQRVARAAGLGLRPELLARIRDTETQVGKSANQRLLNVRGAFAVPQQQRAGLAGRRVLLVDDLMTPGATLGACARALRRGGSGPVYGLTLFSTHRELEPPGEL